MPGKISTDLPVSIDIECEDLRGRFPEFDPVDARQYGISGFDQKIYTHSNVTLVGAGGLGGEYAEGFVRKGIGHLDLFDGDDIQPSNLNRQLFTAADIGKNKAIALATNLHDHGFLGTKLHGHPFFFQEWIEKRQPLSTDLIICGVDNDETRAFVAAYAVREKIPAIFTAVSRDANQGYVFIQEPEGSCFGCAFPDAIANQSSPCPGIPALKDILKVMGGIVLFAADSVLMGRKRNWNYRMVHLSGFMPDSMRNVVRNPKCRICSKS